MRVDRNGWVRPTFLDWLAYRWFYSRWNTILIHRRDLRKYLAGALDAWDGPEAPDSLAAYEERVG